MQHHQDFQAILDSVSILGYYSYSIKGMVRDLGITSQDGQANRPEANAIAASFIDLLAGRPIRDDLPALTKALLDALSLDIYANLYIRPQSTVASDSKPTGDRSFFVKLSAANSGVGGWEPGWTIVDIESDEQIAVEKDGMVFWVDKPRVRTRSNFIVGSKCRVHVPKEIPFLMPGYYFVIGNGSGSDAPDEEGDSIRFYWHVTPFGAIELIRHASHLFNLEGIFFRLKVMSDPAYYSRSDSGVLFLSNSVADAGFRLVEQVHERISDNLSHDVPMFTCRIASGVSWAVDPGVRLSFGQLLSRACAFALYHAFLRQKSGEKITITDFLESLAGLGLDIIKPHLIHSSKSGISVPRI